MASDSRQQIDLGLRMEDRLVSHECKGRLRCGTSLKQGGVEGKHVEYKLKTAHVLLST